MGISYRKRHRRGYAKEAQGYTEWIEWQVTDGHKVVARFDHMKQAQDYALELIGKSLEPEPASDE